MSEPIDLSSTFLHLSNDGNVRGVPLTPEFWSESSKSKLYDRLVGTYEFESSEDLHSSMQEMHPEADEVLFLLSGAIEVVLQEADGEKRSISLEAGQAAVVPRGVWHHLITRTPGKILFINSRTGMRSRDVDAA